MITDTSVGCCEYIRTSYLLFDIGLKSHELVGVGYQNKQKRRIDCIKKE